MPSLRTLLAGLVVWGCGCSALAATPVSVFPLTERGRDVSLRASSKALTGHSASVVVELTASRAQSSVKVILVSRSRALSITPHTCELHSLLPPAVGHATGPPYPLPATPLCTFVVSASAAGRYYITVTVENSVGRKLLSPVIGVLSFEGAGQ